MWSAIIVTLETPDFLKVNVLHVGAHLFTYGDTHLQSLVMGIELLDAHYCA